MSNKYCTIYIVRHAQSVHNAEYDDKKEDLTKANELGSRLTNFGIEQATARAKALKNVHFDKIFSSDFLRAKQTADIIALEHKLEVITNKLLREKYWGSYEGRLHKMDWEKLTALQKGLSDIEKMKVKISDDMESEYEALSRFIIFLREVSIAYIGKTIMVVCHGNIMRSLLTHLGFGSYDELPVGVIDNTGYYVLESDGVDFFIKETVGVNKE